MGNRRRHEPRGPWQHGVLAVGWLVLAALVVALLARSARAVPIVQRWESVDLPLRPTIFPWFEWKPEQSALYRPITPISTTWSSGMPLSQRQSVLELPPGCHDLLLRAVEHVAYPATEFYEAGLYVTVSPYHPTHPPKRVGTCIGTPVVAVPEPGGVGLAVGVLVLGIAAGSSRGEGRRVDRRAALDRGVRPEAGVSGRTPALEQGYKGDRT